MNQYHGNVQEVIEAVRMPSDAEIIGVGVIPGERGNGGNGGNGKDGDIDLGLPKMYEPGNGGGNGVYEESR